MTPWIVSAIVSTCVLLIEFLLWKRFSYCLRGIGLPYLGNSGIVSKKRLNAFCLIHAIFLCFFLSFLIITGW